MKLTTKILTFVMLMLLISASGVATLVMVENSALSDRVSEERVQLAVTDTEGNINEMLQKSEQSAMLLAGNQQLISGVKNNDFNGLKAFLDDINSKINLSTISVTDGNGNVIIRQHQPEKKGDSIYKQTNVQKALAGQVYSTIESGALVKLSCRSGAPIKDESGKIVGTVVVGYVFEDSGLLDALKARHNMDFSIFSGGERIATTLMQDEQRALGTKLDETINDAVTVRGETYAGKADVLGAMYLTSYAALKDTQGNTVGVIGVEMPLAEAEAAKSATFLHVLIVVPVVLFICNSILFAFIKSRLGKPMAVLTKASDALAQGRMDFDLDLKNRKDEIGVLGRAFEGVVNVFKKLTADIQTQLNGLAEGNLGARTDETTYTGEFKNIIGGVNRTVDTLVKYMDSLPTPAMMIDKEFNIRYMNLNGAELLGKTQQELIGCKCYDNFKTSDCRTEKCACYRAMRDVRKAESETDAHPNGTNREIQYFGVPIVKDGEVVGAFEAVTDLTLLKKAKAAAEEQTQALTELLSNINIASEQMVSGTNQVSAASQAVSQGATEQASAIEELTASIAQIAEQTKQNALNANEANEFAGKAKKDAFAGNEKMQQMQQAMEEINESSANIGKIIKAIDEIAFQTNILALNAAVEAARAGSNGKGFAVVAEEVRNLAARSAASAQETTTLIAESIQKTKNGTDIANQTAQALLNIVNGVEKVEQLVHDIAVASDNQTTDIWQINRGIDQVSQVIQTNSATAEETAAASQELSSQAEMLKTMVGSFRVLDLHHEATDAGSAAASEDQPQAKPSSFKRESAYRLNDVEFGKY
ncbi:MAG: methyl-accepting chemotaxis protein [Bacillota bacterium]